MWVLWVVLAIVVIAVIVLLLMWSRRRRAGRVILTRSDVPRAGGGRP